MPRRHVTLWQQHVEKWRDCTRCPLHSTRCTVVLGRGVVPCDVLLVGEAPGRSEDVSGEPFVGPSGRLLDDVVREAGDGLTLTFAFTNLLACAPFGGEDGDGLTFPQPEDLKACHPRLEELVRIARPTYLVAVGALAERHLGPLIGSKKFVSIPHPSRILQSPVVMQRTLYERAVILLRDLLREAV